LSFNLDAKVLRLQSDSDTILVASSAADATKKAALAEIGVQLIEAPLKQNLIDLTALMDTLGTMNVTSLLVEGGSRVSGAFIRSGLADKLLFFFAPKILGGDDGVPILRGRGAETMDQAIRVEDLQMQRIGEDVLIEGYLNKV
jgi:diaminohydroxyphosphoribosylaminopyrimidine deaminase/5-amino-6-(5-phosphoribosylamino)uracil reductase